MKSVSIIGVGRVGGAIALALNRKGYLLENLVARNSINAENIIGGFVAKPNLCGLSDIDEITSDIVFICTQDSEIEGVVDDLMEKVFERKTCIFHTSGSLSSEILAKLKDKNCIVGSIHPLVSVSDSHLGVRRFCDAYFCLEGEDSAVQVAEKLVDDLGGKAFTIDSKYKSLYHASAVVACGHIVALIDASMEILKKCGLDSDSSKEILMPLIKSTLDNLEEQKNSEALTGTFARADFETFEQHLETIDKNMGVEILEIYLNLGMRSLKLAKKQGIDEARIEKMSNKLSLAKKKLKC